MTNASRAAPPVTARARSWPGGKLFAHWYEWLVPVAAALILLPLGAKHFLLFHVTAEVFSSVVGVLVFVVAASTYRFSRNDFLLVIGAGYFWVAILDLVHMVSYKGMNILPGDSANPATQYWIAARVLEAATLLVAPLFLRLRVRPALAFLGFAALALGAEEAVRQGFFPDAYIDGVGLTDFKIITEYVVVCAMIVAGAMVWRARARLPKGLLPLVLASVALTVVAELHFTAYVGVYDFANQVGHLLKIGSFWFIFLATVRVTLVDPFSAMSRDANTLHAVPDPTLVVARDGRLITANAAARRELAEEFSLEPGDAPFANVVGAAVAAAIEGAHTLPPGTVLRVGDAFYDASATPVRGREQGDASVVVLRDVTARVLAEQEKEKALHALARSNAELEQFAYVASHDLQEPMRQVASYVGLLKRRYGDHLDEEAHEYIGYAVEGVHRLQSIVEDLLLFSRAAHGPVDLVPVDSRGALNTAMAAIAARAADVGAHIATPPVMPQVLSAAGPLVEVFRHLIENALIYRHPARAPQVAVEVRPAGQDAWAFTVRDNGVGIEPAFHDRIFVLFKRLQTRAHHPGNGIGLPLVRQIVERHGGTVSLASAPGEGTAVTFTLQAAQEMGLPPLPLSRPFSATPN